MKPAVTELSRLVIDLVLYRWHTITTLGTDLYFTLWTKSYTLLFEQNQEFSKPYDPRQYIAFVKSVTSLILSNSKFSQLYALVYGWLTEI